jgi:small-conductance mechanosensitive channel
VAWLQNPVYPLAVPFTVLLLLLFVLLQGATRNALIKKRVRLNLLLLSVVLILQLFRLWFLPEAPHGSSLENRREKIQSIELLLITLAGINALVALVFNRFKAAGPSEKYPAIVQDTFVIATFVATATYLWPERLLTTSAMGAVIIGFALQDTLGNLFAGLAIQVEKPFRVGDWIRVAEHEGLVLEVTWRATKIRTKSGNFIIVPNSLISKDKIVNYSQPTPVLRLEHTVGIGYEFPPNQVKQIVLDTIAEVPEALEDPPPDVLLIDYHDFAVHYRCRFWIDNFAQSEPILDRFMTLLYYRLKRAGISIPYPIQDLRVTQWKEAAPLPPEVSDRLQFVDKVDLFHALDSSAKNLIAEAMHRQTFGSDETIIRQGTPGDAMFFIRSGSVRIVLDGADEESEIAVLAAGQYFGEMALLTGEPRSASAIAEGDVEAYVLHKDQLREVLLLQPSIAEEISREVAERRNVLDKKSAQAAERALSRKEVQQNFLRRMQRFFRL